MEKPNLSYIEEISGGDEDFKNNMIAILKVEFPLELESIVQSFKENNFNEVSFYTHKVKHKIAMLGMPKSYELASIFEMEIKKNNTTKYKDFLLILNRIALYLNAK
ncbi:Hpt domain-containing protein [uncultured Polaribacter sp.]|uniref:Hpt domain-containing protein n=1 Tax=uncultured Polaribacter sp. TaxID=174711 RepID=UPI00260FD717|nr:Hpt domain-containing protein [uncultured Polaribacter sp.]